MEISDWLVPLITGLLGAGAALLGQLVSVRSAEITQSRIAAHQAASEARRRSQEEADRLRTERVNSYMDFLSALDKVVAEVVPEDWKPSDYRAWAQKTANQFLPLLTSIEIYGSERVRKIATAIDFEINMAAQKRVQVSLSEFQQELIRAVKIDLGTLEWSIGPRTRRGHPVGYPAAIDELDEQTRAFYDLFTRVERLLPPEKTEEATCSTCGQKILVRPDPIQIMIRRSFCHRCYLIFYYGEEAFDWYRPGEPFQPDFGLNAT